MQPENYPRCQQCQKRLRPNYVIAQVRLDEPDLMGGTSFKTVATKTGEIESFGRDNLFCSTQCGYNWAVKHLKRALATLT